MPKLHRKGAGEPLRDAMNRARLTIEELAEATKTVDPDGKGVSASTIGRLTSRGKSARDRCEEHTAWVVTAALHRLTNTPLQDLFDPPFFIPADSTSTVERSRPDVAANEA